MNFIRSLHRRHLRCSRCRLLWLFGVRDPDRRVGPSAAHPDGMVQIAEASRQFLVIVVVRGHNSHAAALTVPARVEFREGAVANVGAPLNGRVVWRPRTNR